MKKLSYLFILMSFFIVGNVYAASAKMNVSASASTVIVGNTVTVTVKTTSTSSLGGVEYTVSYDPAYLALTKTTSPTGGARTVGYYNEKGHSQMSYTYTFKALKSGKTTVSIVGASAGDDEGKSLSVSTGSTSIRIMTQKELEATYSSNNNLSSLSVEGYELDPVFDKDTLEYTVKLKPDTEMITIYADKEDYRANVIGLGEISVSEGANTIKIDVVAQNGNVKSYTINAIVEEYDPINVSVDGYDYTVVRSKKILTFTNPLFTETTQQIGEYEVPAFYNETTKTTLVALKNSNGEISYFIYDNNTYTKFNELKLGNVDLMIVKKEMPKKYKEVTETINDINYTLYRKKDTSRFSLVYGINLINNNESYYVYDNLENTLQRYDIDTINEYDNLVKKYSIIIYSLAGISVGLTTLLIIALVPKKKNKIKKENKVNKNIELEKE